MRRILLALCLVPFSAWGAITQTVVQSAWQSAGATSPITLDNSGGDDDWATPTAGNLLVCGAAVRRTAGTGDAQVSESTQLTEFTKIESYEFDGSAHVNGYVWIKVAEGDESSIAATIVTTQLSSWNLGCIEYDVGDADISAIDASDDNEDQVSGATATDADTVTTPGVTDITPSTANSLMIAFCAINNTSAWNVSESLSDSYVLDAEMDGASAGHPKMMIGSKVLSSATAQAPTCNTTDTDGANVFGALIAFADSASATVGAVTSDWTDTNHHWRIPFTVTGLGTPADCNLSTGDTLSVTDPGGTSNCTSAGCYCQADAEQMHTTGSLDNTNIDTNLTMTVDDNSTTTSATAAFQLAGPTCIGPGCTEGSGASGCNDTANGCPGSNWTGNVTCPGADTYVESGDNYLYRFVEAFAGDDEDGTGECGDGGTCVLDTVPTVGGVAWHVYDEDAATPEWCTAYLWPAVPQDDGTGGSGGTAGTTETVNFTIGSGANRALYCFAHEGAASVTLTGVTYNGTAMTEAVTQTSGDLSGGIYYMLESAIDTATSSTPGAYNAVLTVSGSTTDKSLYCRSSTGIGQSGPYVTESSATAAGASHTSASFTASTNALVFSGFAIDDSAQTCDSYGAGQTQRNQTNQDTGSEACVTTKTGAGASTTTSATLSGSTNIVGVNLSLPAAATDTTAPTVSSPSLSCTGALCSGSFVTSETNGTGYFWLTTAPSATYTTCQANAQYTAEVVSSPVSKGMTVTATDTYYLHVCHADAEGNIDTQSVASTAGQVISASDCTHKGAWRGMSRSMRRAIKCPVLN